MSEDVKTYDRSLGDPVYTTSCEQEAEREDAMNTQHFDVLIISAGLSGIGQACQVRAALPNKSIAILERRERLGGTWDLFRYPGVRSDSDMYTFGYKFRPWQDVQVLADGPSIREYIAETAAEFGIDDKIHFGLKVVNADWSSAQSRWTVTTLHEASGETRTYTCGFLISCTGYYNFDAGYLPTFPGVDQFKGRCVHPQHWPEDLDYAGKKVVVIGSGATAVTLVPAMAGDAEHVTMLQRSPSYIVSVPGLDKISEILGRCASEVGLEVGAQAQRLPALPLPVFRRCPHDAQIAALAGSTLPRPLIRHEPLHPEVHAVGRAVVPGAECRSLQGAEIR